MTTITYQNESEKEQVETLDFRMQQASQAVDSALSLANEALVQHFSRGYIPENSKIALESQEEQKSFFKRIGEKIQAFFKWIGEVISRIIEFFFGSKKKKEEKELEEELNKFFKENTKAESGFSKSSFEKDIEEMMEAAKKEQDGFYADLEKLRETAAKVPVLKNGHDELNQKYLVHLARRKTLQAYLETRAQKSFFTAVVFSGDGNGLKMFDNAVALVTGDTAKEVSGFFNGDDLIAKSETIDSFVTKTKQEYQKLNADTIENFVSAIISSGLEKIGSFEFRKDAILQIPSYVEMVRERAGKVEQTLNDLNSAFMKADRQFKNSFNKAIESDIKDTRITDEFNIIAEMNKIIRYLVGAARVLLNDLRITGGFDLAFQAYQNSYESMKSAVEKYSNQKEYTVKTVMLAKKLSAEFQ